MKTFKQHVPNFCDGVDPVEAQFDTLEELLNIPFVEQWKHDKNFYQYSLSIHPNQTLLMSEQENGKHWWVIGYISGNIDDLKLPRWEPKK